MLGNAGTFDAWLSTFYFGMNLPASMVRSAKTIGLIAGWCDGRAGRHGGWSDGGQRGAVGCVERPQLGGVHGDPIGRRNAWRPGSPGAPTNSPDRQRRP